MSGQMPDNNYGEEPGSRVKAVAHYFRERVDGQYDGTVLDV